MHRLLFMNIYSEYFHLNMWTLLNVYLIMHFELIFTIFYYRLLNGILNVMMNREKKDLIFETHKLCAVWCVVSGCGVCKMLCILLLL